MLASLEPGDSFAGRYEVQRHLGGGHRKVVYLARDTRMHRDVALALLKPEAIESDPEAAEHETKVLGAIGRHENIVRLYDRDPGRGAPVHGLRVPVRRDAGPIPR